MDYMTLFPGYTRDKPRFAALAAAVLQQVYDLIALVPEMESGFLLPTRWAHSSTPSASPCPFHARAAGTMKPTGASFSGSFGVTSGTG